MISAAVAVRRLWPRRLRTRLAVMYTLMFLLAGAVLLALTYALVVNVLLPAPHPPTKPIPAGIRGLLGRCKPPPAARSLLAECKRAFAAAGLGPFDQRGSTLAALLGAAAIGLGVLAIVSVALGWLVSGRALRPMRSITEAARRASELRLGQRLALSGPDDEVKQLADTFDLMLERLDAAFTSQKRFVANAAHELRTPLTAMKTAIEVTLSKPARTPEQLEVMAARVKRSVEQAEETVEALLTLASSELGPANPEEVDLAVAAEDALDAMRGAIEQRELEVDAELEPAIARGDPVLLERMVANLVENAIRHNVHGGWIGISTRELPAGAVLEVANTGASIPAEQIPTLFEPFARGNGRLSSSDGVGLGLSIAEAIADAHDATVAASPRAGGGLVVSITIPTAPAP